MYLENDIKIRSDGAYEDLVVVFGIKFSTNAISVLIDALVEDLSLEVWGYTSVEGSKQWSWVNWHVANAKKKSIKQIVLKREVDGHMESVMTGKLNTIQQWGGNREKSELRSSGPTGRPAIPS